MSQQATSQPQVKNELSESAGATQDTLLRKEIAVQKAGFASEYLQLQQANNKLQWQVHNSKVHNFIILVVIVFIILTLVYDYITIDARFHTMINYVDKVRAPNGAYEGPSGTAIAYAYTYPWYNNNFLQDTGNRNWPFAVVYAMNTPAYANTLLSDSSGKILQTMYRYANANNNASADEIICKSGPFSGAQGCVTCKPTVQTGAGGWLHGILGGAAQFGVIGGPLMFINPLAGGLVLAAGMVYGGISHNSQVDNCKQNEQGCPKDC